MKTIILKIGGSIVTNKGSSKPTVNYSDLRKIAKQLARIKKTYILIHGAGSFGHNIVKRTGIDKGIKSKKDLLWLAETQRLQNELNVIITRELAWI